MTTTFQLPALEVMTASLHSTKKDLLCLIENCKKSMSSPMLDRSDKTRLRQWLGELSDQLAEIDRQLGV